MIPVSLRPQIFHQNNHSSSMTFETTCSRYVRCRWSLPKSTAHQPAGQANESPLPNHTKEAANFFLSLRMKRRSLDAITVCHLRHPMMLVANLRDVDIHFDDGDWKAERRSSAGVESCLPIARAIGTRWSKRKKAHSKRGILNYTLLFTPVGRDDSCEKHRGYLCQFTTTHWS